MKKWLCIVLLLAVFAAVLGGCGKRSDDKGATTDKVPEILNQEEYLLYQNVFFNDYGKQLIGKEVSKKGVLAVIQDGFNQRTRYYVWGYLDNTKCCDWQWEFVPEDSAVLPQPGSLVSVKGTFAAHDDALDGYWIEKAAVETNTKYTGEVFDLDMCAMSCTLERVQMLNILYKPEYFKERSFIAYGRIVASGTLEDPYYNGSWQMPFAPGDASFAIGTQVKLQGSVINGKLTDCTVTNAE